MADGYTIYVCPICGDQIENDYEMGTLCFHDGREVEAITVAVEPRGLRPAMALARLRLQEENRDRDWALAEVRFWQRLPEDEKRRRLAAMPLEIRMLHNMRDNLLRQLAYMQPANQRETGGVYRFEREPAS